MKKKIRYIIIAFLLSFIIIASLCVYATRQYASLIAYSEQVDHTNAVITRLYTIQDVLRDFDMREREYMIIRDGSVVTGYNKQITKLNQEIKELRELVSDNDDQLHSLILFKSSLALRVGYFKNNMEFLDTASNNILSPYYLNAGSLKAECYAYISQMLDRENVLLKARVSNKMQVQYITSGTTKFLLVLFLIITLFLFFVMMYELKQKNRYQDELYAHMVDLENSHAELEQIAFAASHDLKEPLRKIKIFSDRLLWLNKESTNPDVENAVAAITGAANRAQELTGEIIKLANLIKEKNIQDNVSLDAIVHGVLNDIDDKIISKKANVQLVPLPVIAGDVAQLKILFTHLFENALKFAKKDVPPVIKISTELISGKEIDAQDKGIEHKKYHRIMISDNGIGFDNAFIHKIFKVFQRLHNDQSMYEGKGIGLAICQRVMINHLGFIAASGQPGIGATFVLYFPAE